MTSSAADVVSAPAQPAKPAAQPRASVLSTRIVGPWGPLIALPVIAGLVAIFLTVTWLLVRPMMLLFAAIVIAEAVAPIVSRLERRLPRTISIVIVYLTLLLAFGLALTAMAAPLTSQATTLIADAPQLVADMQERINRFDPLGNGGLSEGLEQSVTGFSGTLVNLPLAIVASLAEILLVVVMSIYWLITAPALRRFLHSVMPGRHRERFDEVTEAIGQTMGGYVRATAINSVIVGVIVYAGLQVIGVEFPVVLALIAALGELIPVAGPVLTAIPAIIVGLLESPTQALIVLGFYVVLQQIESHILMPNIMHKQADVPPLLAILALVAGASVGGILGALIAIPLAGALRVVIVQVVAPLVRKWWGLPPDIEERLEQEDADPPVQPGAATA